MTDQTLPAFCTPKRLPPKMRVEAAGRAIQENPANAPPVNRMVELLNSVWSAIGLSLDQHPTDPSQVMQPQHIAIMTTKWWGTKRRHTVSFRETTKPELKAKIVAYANKWNQDRPSCAGHDGIPGADVEFVLFDGGNWQEADVRISRDKGGYWSYVGTDNGMIPKDEQTMNLEWFVLSTPDSEFDRVVCHEFGHYLGAVHEHMRADLVARLDRAKVEDYFMRTQGWSRSEVDAQVLTPLSESLLKGTADEADSIMCYHINPELTLDGKGIAGGTRITDDDLAFMAGVYPKTVPVAAASSRYRYTIESDSPIVFTPV